MKTETDLCTHTLLSATKQKEAKRKTVMENPLKIIEIQFVLPRKMKINFWSIPILPKHFYYKKKERANKSQVTSTHRKTSKWCVSSMIGIVLSRNVFFISLVTMKMEMEWKTTRKSIQKKTLKRNRKPRTTTLCIFAFDIAG